MEDTLQRFFSILLSVMIFFLLPMYMAFEKKDDISYSLALKMTSTFVDEVCNKGYMTIDMYNDFVSELALTGNDYDISIEHVSKVYNPVIYAYKDGKQYSFDYNLYKRSYNGNSSIDINGVTYDNATLSYKVSELKYSTEQILRVMDQDAIKDSDSLLNKIDYTYNEQTKQYEYSSLNLSNLEKYKTLDVNKISPVSGLYRTTSGKTVYPMNEGDRITVVIKNTNISIASVLFNTLTFGARTGADTKVYINYGGTIKNEEYRYTVIDTTVTEDATNLEINNENCEEQGHNFVEQELKDSHENVKEKNKFNDITNIVVGAYGTNTLSGATLEINSIVYVSSVYRYGNNNAKGYYKVISRSENGMYYTSEYLGATYKVDSCSRCGTIEDCNTLGHDYIATELSECSAEIKTAYNFIGIVQANRGNYNFPVYARVGDIFIIQTGESIYYYRIKTVTKKYGVTSPECTFEPLGNSYKINICSRCGNHVR